MSADRIEIEKGWQRIHELLPAMKLVNEEDNWLKKEGHQLWKSYFRLIDHHCRQGKLIAPPDASALKQHLDDLLSCKPTPTFILSLATLDCVLLESPTAGNESSNTLRQLLDRALEPVNSSELVLQGAGMLLAELLDHELGQRTFELHARQIARACASARWKLSSWDMPIDPEQALDSLPVLGLHWQSHHLQGHILAIDEGMRTTWRLLKEHPQNGRDPELALYQPGTSWNSRLIRHLRRFYNTPPSRMLELLNNQSH